MPISASPAKLYGYNKHLHNNIPEAYRVINLPKLCTVLTFISLIISINLFIFLVVIVVICLSVTFFIQQDCVKMMKESRGKKQKKKISACYFWPLCCLFIQSLCLHFMCFLILSLAFWTSQRRRKTLVFILVFAIIIITDAAITIVVIVMEILHIILLKLVRHKQMFIKT